ncbi:FG-GAP repeat domain-containing protein [Streptosporangium roseum]|uniref:FG-GAP repeat domain-containing protein n=2 Tax=Streptosporangium TaxID=2000 RepID=UPI00068D199E|nr:FG-GAP-like repeat-containing protein [Streptosporangium roseum]
MKATSGIRKYAAGALALTACTAGWRLTGLPDTSAAEAAAGFSFTASPLGPADRPGDRNLRPVAPAYRDIRAWASSTGAGIALFDADNAVVSDDVCLVDPRHDTVTVSPAPGTPRHYRPFTLAAPARRPYEAPTGCLPADLDQDGWQDLVVYYWGRSPSLFIRVPGAPPSGAAFRHRDLTPEPEIWNTGAATAGDFDGDGRLDLVFGNYFPDGARVLDDTADHAAVAMPGSPSDAGGGGGGGGVNRLYRATGPARFTEAKGVFDGAGTGGRGWTLALGTQDLDGDGRPDLYVANDFGPDELLVNESVPGRIRFREARGTRHLTTPRSNVVGQDSFKSMGVGFTDLNTDGTPDILVSNLTEDPGAYESDFAFVSRPGGLHGGHAPYDDHGEDLGLSRTGWSWDVKAADFDNDGTDEIMHATGSVRGAGDRWAPPREAVSGTPLPSEPTPGTDTGAENRDRAEAGDRDRDRAQAQAEAGAGAGAGDRDRDGVGAGAGDRDDGLSGGGTNSFFVRGPGGRYVDVARRAGVGGDTVSRSFAVGDVDDDGRLDFAVANQWAASVLYRNNGATAPFVGLRLRLPAGSCGTAIAPTPSTPHAPSAHRPAPPLSAPTPSTPHAPFARRPAPPLSVLTAPLGHRPAPPLVGPFAHHLASSLSALLSPLPARPPLVRSRLTLSALVGPAPSGSGPPPSRPPLTRPTTPGPAWTRPAIGATATVRLPGGSTLSRQLYPANGHNGVSAPELLFGLGGDAPGGPLPVELSWRDACGVLRTASVSVRPGWHRILLADGRASEMD